MPNVDLARIEAVLGLLPPGGELAVDANGRFVGKNARVISGDVAGALAQALRANLPWTVTAVEEKPGVERPAPPFTTSTLTQEASRKLGFSTERTMQVAQRLFQGVDVGNGQMEGLISYHRTDSTTLSDKALEEAAAARVVARLRVEVESPTIGRCRSCGQPCAPWFPLCDRCAGTRRRS